MFGAKKIRCMKCNSEVSKKFDYCPHCASPLRDLKKEYGLLGRTDDIMDRQFEHAFSNSFSSSIFNKMLSSAVKMLNNEMIKKTKEMEKSEINGSNLKNNFELYVNGRKINLPSNAELQIEEIPFQEESIKKPKQPRSKMPQPRISEDILEKSKKLPRKEAKSSIRRTSDRVVYELSTPGLSSLNNVLINKLEDSLEIKAYTEKVVYCKLLPAKLPLVQYSINPSEGKLILEFKAQ
jgi:hypothetical protein